MTGIDPDQSFSEHMKKTFQHHGVDLKKKEKVVGLHRFRGVKVIYTSYFNYLRNTYGFHGMPLIIHCVFFKHQPFLRQVVNEALAERAKIKKRLADENLAPDEIQVLKSKSNQTKLLINGCYGYTLCRTNTLNTPYVREKLRTKKYHREMMKKGISKTQKNHIATVREFNRDYLVVTTKTVDPKYGPTTPVIPIGAAILGNSKEKR